MTKEQKKNQSEEKVEQLEEVRKHLNLGHNEWVRRLHPIELERLNMMPDNHTSGHSPSKRAFLMGNALVVGIITELALEIESRL